MTRRMPVAIATLSAVALAGAGAADAAKKPATKALTAKLTGAAEVPASGDPDGKGTAVLRFNQKRGTVCFTITMQRIAGSSAAHIHEGAAGVAGPVRVTLFAGKSARRQRTGCVSNVDARSCAGSSRSRAASTSTSTPRSSPTARCADSSAPRPKRSCQRRTRAAGRG